MSTLHAYFLKRDVSQPVAPARNSQVSCASAAASVGISTNASATSTVPSPIVAEDESKNKTCWAMDEKLNIVLYALQHGAGAAMVKYGVKRPTLAVWRRIYQQAEEAALAATPVGAAPMPVDSSVFADKRGKNGRTLPKAVIDEVTASFDRAREKGLAVSRQDLRCKLVASVTTHCPKVLKSQGGWLTAGDEFMATLERELGLSKRRATTAKRADVDKSKWRTIYLARLSTVCRRSNIPLGLVYHVDETSVELVPAAKRTLERRGARVVRIAGSDDKRQVTVMVGGAMDADVLRPQIVFAGKTDRVLPAECHGADLAHSHNHWVTPQTTMQWLDNVLKPAILAKKSALGLLPSHPAVLTWDVYCTHRSREIRAYIATTMPWLQLVYVPANCTNDLQIADVCMNRPLHVRVTKQYEAWVISKYLEDEEDSEAELKLPIAELRQQCVQWVTQALADMKSTRLAAKGITKVGVSTILGDEWPSIIDDLNKQGLLWSTTTSNNVVAYCGNPGIIAPLTGEPPVAQVEFSDSDDSEMLQSTIGHATSSSDTQSTIKRQPSVGHKRKRKQTVQRCTVCRQTGHNRASCSVRPTHFSNIAVAAPSDDASK